MSANLRQGPCRDYQRGSIDVPLTSYLIDLDVCFATRAKITRVTNIFKLRPKKRVYNTNLLNSS